MRALTLALALVAPLTARAELVITDWQTTGDQALMWDTVSNREWLRLDFTAGQSAHEVWARSDLRSFTFASMQDVEQLLDNAGVSPRVPAPDTETKLLISYWGLGGADGDPDYVTLRALTNDCHSRCGSSGQVQFVVMMGYGRLDPDLSSWAYTSAAAMGADEAQADTGSALWRLRAQEDPATPLPLPGSLSLAALGLLAAAGGGRRPAAH